VKSTCSSPCHRYQIRKYLNCIYLNVTFKVHCEMGSAIYEETAYLHTKGYLKIVNSVCLWQLDLRQRCGDVWCLESITWIEKSRTLFTTYLPRILILTSFEDGNYYLFWTKKFTYLCITLTWGNACLCDIK
jgi:hypothetical protein